MDNDTEQYHIGRTAAYHTIVAMFRAGKKPEDIHDFAMRAEMAAETAANERNAAERAATSPAR